MSLVGPVGRLGDASAFLVGSRQTRLRQRRPKSASQEKLTRRGASGEGFRENSVALEVAVFRAGKSSSGCCLYGRGKGGLSTTRTGVANQTRTAARRPLCTPSAAGLSRVQLLEQPHESYERRFVPRYGEGLVWWDIYRLPRQGGDLRIVSRPGTKAIKREGTWT